MRIAAASIARLSTCYGRRFELMSMPSRTPAMQLCQYGLQTAGQFDLCVLLRLGKVQYVVRDLLEIPGADAA